MGLKLILCLERLSGSHRCSTPFTADGIETRQRQQYQDGYYLGCSTPFPADGIETVFPLLVPALVLCCSTPFPADGIETDIQSHLAEGSHHRCSTPFPADGISVYDILSRMSTMTPTIEQLVTIYEALPREKASQLLDFARYLHAGSHRQPKRGSAVAILASLEHSQLAFEDGELDGLLAEIDMMRELDLHDG